VAIGPSMIGAGDRTGAAADRFAGAWRAFNATHAWKDVSLVISAAFIKRWLGDLDGCDVALDGDDPSDTLRPKAAPFGACAKTTAPTARRCWRFSCAHRPACAAALDPLGQRGLHGHMGAGTTAGPKGDAR
jgi:hypothetical protein